MTCEKVGGGATCCPPGGASLEGALRALRATLETVRRREIERHAHRFENADRKDLDRLTHAIMQRVLDVPVTCAGELETRRLCPERDAALLATLFTPAT